MFRSDWNLYAAIGIIIAIVSLSAIEANYERGQTKTQNHSYNPASVTHTSPPKPPIVNALNTPNGLKFTGLYGGFDCYHGNSDEQYRVCTDRENIKAAQQNSFWTLLTVLIGLVGTIFVVKAITISANANKLSAENLRISLLQSRPWLKLDMKQRAEWEAPAWEGAPGKLHISFKCRNVGIGPAINICIWSNIVDLFDENQIRNALAHTDRSMDTKTPIYFPRKPLKSYHGLLVDMLLFDGIEDGRLGVVIGAEYNIPGDQITRRMAVLYQAFLVMKPTEGRNGEIVPGIYLVPKPDQKINPT